MAVQPHRLGLVASPQRRNDRRRLGALRNPGQVTRDHRVSSDPRPRRSTTSEMSHNVGEILRFGPTLWLVSARTAHAVPLIVPLQDPRRRDPSRPTTAEMSRNDGGRSRTAPEIWLFSARAPPAPAPRFPASSCATRIGRGPRAGAPGEPLARRSRTPAATGQRARRPERRARCRCSTGPGSPRYPHAKPTSADPSSAAAKRNFSRAAWRSSIPSSHSSYEVRSPKTSTYTSQISGERERTSASLKNRSPLVPPRTQTPWDSARTLLAGMSHNRGKTSRSAPQLRLISARTARDARRIRMLVALGTEGCGEVVGRVAPARHGH